MIKCKEKKVTIHLLLYPIKILVFQLRKHTWLRFAKINLKYQKSINNKINK